MLWYSVPGFTSIECNEQGDIRSTSTCKLRKQQLKTGKPGQSCRRWIDVREPGKPRKKPYSARLILSAKLGRELHPWEDACHINGDAGDNRMCNLEAKCRLNNIIDEIESGRIQTTPEQIDKAIARLMAIKEKIQ